MEKVVVDNGKISPNQFKILVTLVFVGTAVLLIPGLLAEEAKQDAWIASILGTLGALVLAWFYNLLTEQMKTMSIIEYSKKVMGKWVGGIMALAFVIYLFITATTIVWVVGNFITTQLMRETPLIVINTLFVIVVVIGSRLGIESIGRTAEVFFPWVFGGIVFLLFFALPDAKVENLQPIFEYGIKPIIIASTYFHGFISLTMVVLLIIFPANLSDFQEGKKAFYKGICTAGILITLITLLSIMVLGASSTARNAFPSYALAKQIDIGHFLERIEAILGMVWIITVFFKTILYFYGASVGLARLFKLDNYKLFTLPLGTLMIMLSVVFYPDAVYAAEWDTTTWMSFVITFGFLYTFSLFILGKIRRG
jgi:spore germination protein KB